MQDWRAPDWRRARLAVAAGHVIRLVAKGFRFAVKIFPFIHWKHLDLVRIFTSSATNTSEQAMKSVVPIVLALIPLFAVVGACVAAP